MTIRSDKSVNSLRSIRLIILWVTVVVLGTQALVIASGLSVNSEVRSGIYPLGKEVVFTISGAEPADLDNVSVTVMRDGFTKLASVETEKAGETLEVRFTPEAVGWYMCEALPAGADRRTQTARAGVVVAPEMIKASLPAPADFDAFWNARKAALKAMPMQAQLKPMDVSDQAVECFDLEIPCPDTKPVRGYYARPKGASPHSRAAILYLRAAGVAGNWCRASTQNAMSLAKEYNAIVVDINAHGMLNDQSEEYYKDLEQGELRGYWTHGSDDRDKFYFVGMYVRLLRAIDFIATRDEWDGKHLITTGESQGGGQTLAAAGLDQRVSAAVALVPAMCDFTGPVVGRLGGWPRPIDRDVESEHAKKVIAAVRYCDNINLASRSRAETLIFVGLIDTTCSAPGIFSTYNTLPGPKQIVVYPHKPHVGLPAEDRWIGDISALRKAFIQRHVADRPIEN